MDENVEIGEKMVLSSVFKWHSLRVIIVVTALVLLLLASSVGAVSEQPEQKVSKESWGGWFSGLIENIFKYLSTPEKSINNGEADVEPTHESVVNTDSQLDVIINPEDGKYIPDLSKSSYKEPTNPFAASGFGGQCTAFAWGRAHEKLGDSIAKKLPTRHAKYWYDTTKLPKGSTARANSIAVWNGTDKYPNGHVAYVEAVNGDNILINEANYKSFKKTNGNWGGGYDGEPNPLTTAEMMKRPNTGELLGYIYLESTIPTPVPTTPVPTTPVPTTPVPTTPVPTTPAPTTPAPTTPAPTTPAPTTPAPTTPVPTTPVPTTPVPTTPVPTTPIPTTPVPTTPVPTPTLSVSPTSGQQGTTFYYSGNQYTPNGIVEWHVRKPDGVEYPLTDLTGKVDGSGNFNHNYVSHCESMVGIYTLWAFDKSTGRRSNDVPQTIIASASCVSVQYQAHFAYTDWMTNWAQDGQRIGTPGGNQMEAIRIKTTKYGIRYSAHVANIGWLPWVYNSADAGTTGQAKSLQAIKIELQNAPSNLHVYYRVYVHGQGWQGWVSDGALAGTTDQALAVDAIEIKIQS